MAARASEDGTLGGRKEVGRERAREHHTSARQAEKGDKEREARNAQNAKNQAPGRIVLRIGGGLGCTCWIEIVSVRSDWPIGYGSSSRAFKGTIFTNYFVKFGDLI